MNLQMVLKLKGKLLLKNSLKIESKLFAVFLCLQGFLAPLVVLHENKQ